MGYTSGMSELKTVRTDESVEAFIGSIENDTRREDSIKLLNIFSRATGMKPALWGTSIVGYGQYHYKSDRSTQEGDWPLVAFSPRKQNLTLYIMPGFDGYETLLEKLGKHKTSVSCLYINKLADVDEEVLAQIITKSLVDMRRQFPNSIAT